MDDNVVVHIKELPRDWDSYVEEFSHASWYCKAQWKRVVEEAFGHQPFYLSIRQGGKLEGVLPLILVESVFFGRFLVSVPYAGWGGIFAHNDKAKTLLIEKAKSIAREKNVNYLELRFLGEVLCDGLGFAIKRKATFCVDLEKPIEDFWKTLKDDIRHGVKKSLSSGCSVEIGGEELLEQFYRVFCLRMHELGTPVYSRKFFQTIVNVYGVQTRIIVVRMNEEPIGGGILVQDGQKLEIPWSASSSQWFKFHPNSLMYWKAIQFASEKKCRVFDFGTSAIGSGNAQYKMRWGAREIPLSCGRFYVKGAPNDNLELGNKRFERAIDLWKKMPISFANFAGPWLTKGIP